MTAHKMRTTQMISNKIFLDRNDIKSSRMRLRYQSHEHIIINNEPYQSEFHWFVTQQSKVHHGKRIKRQKKVVPKSTPRCVKINTESICRVS